MRKLIGVLLTVALMVSLSLVAVVPGRVTAAYYVSDDVGNVYDILLSNVAVSEGLDFLEGDQDNRIAEQIVICEIPAPPFNEQLRAEDYMARMIDLGLEDVHIDDEGNVIGYRLGTGDGPKLVVAAHLDTVFPLGYDATVTIDDEGILHAPGIGDDCGGLAALLSVVRALNDSGITTVGDIMFVGTVGEEGRGDLRGVKNLFSEHEDIDGFLSIDGSGTTGITYLGLGSKRFEFTYTGAGGHSWGAFGIPSPIHAMGRSIAKIADMKVPTDPRTSFTVSVVEGGTSINAIAAEVVMQTDTRSLDPAQLEETVAELLAYVDQGVVEENARWGISTTPGLDKTPPGLDDGPPGLDIANPPGLDKANPPGLRLPDEWADKYGITVDVNMVGDRPSGTCPDDAIHVQVACAATEAIGAVPRLGWPSSTDSNIPIFLGVPALTLGGGGRGGAGHSPDEWFNPTDAYLGPQRVLLTVLGLVGVDDVTAPLLPPGPEYHYEFLGVEVPDMYIP